MNTCITCKYHTIAHTVNLTPYSGDFCIASDSVKIDPVSGDTTSIKVCGDRRTDKEDACGIDGKLYKESVAGAIGSVVMIILIIILVVHISGILS